ncbi:fimbrial protein [Providencia stuartii]|uniref:Uncharacterized protein n=2 Tax=Providencia TaxID=586 RepID=A0A1S1HVZ8_PROST|nr:MULTISPECIES: hypothetical protein [Providencia]ELR5041485.1 fimbrial protein [Providencia stuartii]ELR5083581.1 fimbrial protein [Providencia stuartii]ELR5299272.1 fimbrial protein [Providencia stuartii]MDW7588345.1 fimbrial protein [Providencia sp. 2023EL-00965]MDX4945897.1 fimbrial protein [Providencia manganoxydans]
MKKKSIWWLLCILASQYTIAATPVANTPVNQMDYESIHSGQIQVNAIVFNSPCNWSWQGVEHILLTKCGAGAEFVGVSTTPATVQFYDIQRGHFFPLHFLQLIDGNNKIRIPWAANKYRLLRLEVGYE